LTNGVFVRGSADDQLSQPFDQHESGMSLIGVPDSWIDLHGPKHSHAAYAENPLLPEPHLRTTGIELVHETAVFRVVRFEVGVEQVDGNSPDHHPPCAYVNRATRGLHRCKPRLSVRPSDRDKGSRAYVVLLIAVFLPAFQVQSLVEISFAIEEADTYQGDAKIAGRLAMIAGKNAQAPGVDGNRVVQAELGAKVCYRAPIQLGVRVREPGLTTVSLPRHLLHYIVVAPQKLAIAGAGGYSGGIYPA
jgi:hypothetical protein